jgi:hypothetical protein
MNRALALLAATAAMICMNACRTDITRQGPPFTIDSLMTYSSTGLQTLIGESNLKDSVGPADEPGTRHWYTLLLPGTPSEALICWMDSTRQQMWEVTVRAKPGLNNLWMTRDSLRIGMSLSEVQRINAVTFWVYPDGTTSNFGLGVLDDHLSSLRFAFNGSAPSQTVSSDHEPLRGLNPVIRSFSVSRWALPAQVIVIKKPVTVKDRTEYIPQVINHYGNPDIHVDRINQAILETFELKSFDQAPRDFHWSDIAFTWEADHGFLALQYSGTVVAAYPTDVHETLYFTLADGKPINTGRIPFIAFLNYDQFFPFFQKYWLAQCSAKQTAAAKCADGKTNCDCYDNIRLSTTDNKINLSLESEECLPHANMACAPQHTLSLTLDELAPFLNDYGKKYLQQYAGPGLLNKLSIYKDYVSGELPPMIFMKLPPGEPIVEGQEMPEKLIAVQFNKDRTIKGYTVDGPIHGQRPEYMGDAGPFALSGRYDLAGFSISATSEENGTQEWLSFEWSQEPTSVTSGSLYLRTDAPVAFIKHTGNTPGDDWFKDFYRSILSAQAQLEINAARSESSSGIDLSDNPTTVSCTYQGTEEGDCYHILFSCGDFVAAKTQLSQVEQALWDDLENYEGRSFQITYSKTEGWPCQAGYPDTSQMTRGDVPLITRFKLLD